MTSLLLDTNILVRHLRDDDPVQSPRATQLFKEADEQRCLLYVTDAVIAETVWVFRSVYDKPPAAIAEALATLLGSAGVVCERQTVMLDALHRFGHTGLDIVDCLLAAQAESEGKRLATFDRALHQSLSDHTAWGMV